MSSDESQRDSAAGGQPPKGPADDQQASVPRQSRPLVPPRGVWAVVALCGGLVALVRSLDAIDRPAEVGFVRGLLSYLTDHAVVNILTLILSFIAIMTVLLWFSLRSGFSRRLRTVPIVVLAALILAAMLLFRIDGVSGTMVPRFALRFSPKDDQRLAEATVQNDTSGRLEGVDLAATTEHDFPQFLGPARSAALDRIALARDWAERPPKPLWRQEIGAGWSPFVAVNGFALTMEQRDEREMVTCYEVLTGRLRWAQSIDARYETVLGGVGPRAAPTIDEGAVYTLGASGVLHCLDGATGEVRWSRDLPVEFDVTPRQEARTIAYGRSNSPLIVGDLVVVPAGGPKQGSTFSLVAYDKSTGREVWRGGDSQISYSSPVLTTLSGVEQILIVNEDNASGHDAATGERLWRYPWDGKSNTTASVSQAVPVGGDRVFLSKAYGNGAALLKVRRNGGGQWLAETLWHNRRAMKTKFTNVTLRDGYVYGLSDGILECIQLDTGRRVWKRGRYGQGQLLRVGPLLLVQSEYDGLFLVEASPEGHKELGSLRTIEGKTWNNLCLYGPYLLVRNAQEAACYELPLADR